MLRQARTAGSVTLCRNISLSLNGRNGPDLTLDLLGDNHRR
jgi:hypothetical protein